MSSRPPKFKIAVARGLRRRGGPESLNFTAVPFRAVVRYTKIARPSSVRKGPQRS
jgi:hypothetical protein